MLRSILQKYLKFFDSDGESSTEQHNLTFHRQVRDYRVQTVLEVHREQFVSLIMERFTKFMYLSVV